MHPLVTFIVPCYNLGHFLSECVQSILTQTFEDLEVLILDDCSPDATPTVARSFTDPRVRHVRNERNLGHLRTRNKGMTLARGSYLWLIDPDDRLRAPDILARYVELLERDPGISLAFCPGVLFDADGREGPLTGHHFDRDVVLTSEQFLAKCIDCNPVCTPSAISRTALYERMGLFPTDLPFAGDWYVWCVLGSYGSVAYFADAAVNYRRHALSMTAQYRSRRSRRPEEDEIEVRWRLHNILQHARFARLLDASLKTIATDYSTKLLPHALRDATAPFDDDWFLESLRSHCDEPTFALMRAMVSELIGDQLCEHARTPLAAEYYACALRHRRWTRVWTKNRLARLGSIGRIGRHTLSAVKRVAVRAAGG